MGVDYIVRHIPDRYVADGILDAVAESGFDLIVMASHGRRGIARFETHGYISCRIYALS